jgi:hypothetical protein
MPKLLGGDRTTRMCVRDRPICSVQHQVFQAAAGAFQPAQKQSRSSSVSGTPRRENRTGRSQSCQSRFNEQAAFDMHVVITLCAKN